MTAHKRSTVVRDVYIWRTLTFDYNSDTPKCQKTFEAASRSCVQAAFIANLQFATSQLFRATLMSFVLLRMTTRSSLGAVTYTVLSTPLYHIRLARDSSTKPVTTWDNDLVKMNTALYLSVPFKLNQPRNSSWTSLDQPYSHSFRLTPIDSTPLPCMTNCFDLCFSCGSSAGVVGLAWSCQSAIMEPSRLLMKAYIKTT